MESKIDTSNTGFWVQSIEFAWHDGLIYLVFIIIAAGLILFRIRPEERSVLRNAFALFLLSLIGLFISGLMHASGSTEPAKWIHNLFFFVAGIVAIRLVSLLIFRSILPMVQIRMPSILEDVIVFIAFFFWGMMLLGYAGLDLGEIVTMSAVMTAIIAYSMQDTLGNILGGVALQWDHSLKCGDWIRINDIEGKIVDIHWRAVFVETRNWETVVIPNSVMMKNSFKVLGARQQEPVKWRRWIWFNVDYKVSPAKVVAVAESVIDKAGIPNIAQSPAPTCLFMNYETSFGRYALRYWLTDLALDDPTDSLVRQHLFAALERAEITPGLDKQHLYLTKDNEKQEALQHEREIAQRVSVLKGVDLFATFSKSELHHIANELRFAPFSKGDIIVRKGSVDHWLYIVVSGAADAYLKDSESTEPVFEFHHGDFFGEMGLLTGEPRSATVIAKDELVCYRLDKQGFMDVINIRPAIIEDISQVLISRKNKLQQARHDLDEVHEHLAPHKHHFELVNRIRHFFGIIGQGLKN